MSAYIKATQKPDASKALQPGIFCCFRPAAIDENSDDDFLDSHKTDKHNGSFNALPDTKLKHERNDDFESDGNETDQLTSDDSFDERLAEANVLRKADSVRRDTPPKLVLTHPYINGTVNGNATAEKTEKADRIDIDLRGRAESKLSANSNGSAAQPQSLTQQQAAAKVTPQETPKPTPLPTPKMAARLSVKPHADSKTETSSLSNTSVASSSRRKVTIQIEPDVDVDVGIDRRASVKPLDLHADAALVVPSVAPEQTQTQPEAQILLQLPTQSQAQAQPQTTRGSILKLPSATAAESERDSQTAVGRLTLAVTHDEPKSVLFVDIRELVSLNALPSTDGDSQRAQDGDKLEVHVALLPSKQQRRRTSAQPARNAHWNERLRFDKVRVAKLREMGLRVRLYLVRGRPSRRSSFIGSSADDILCEALIAFADYPIVASQPFEFLLTLRWRDALAASTADLTSASDASRRSIVVTSSAMNDAEQPSSSQRAVSMANLNDTKARANSSQSSRASASIADLRNPTGSESHSHRSNSILKGIRFARSNTGSSRSVNHDAPPVYSSGDEDDADSQIIENGVGEADAAKAASNPNKLAGALVINEPEAITPPAIQLSLVYEARIARLTIGISRINIGRANGKMMVKLMLINKVGKTVSDAKTKKFAESAMQSDNQYALDERFSFDLAQHRVTIEDSSVMLTVLVKKSNAGWLVLGKNASSPELTKHWNDMRFPLAAAATNSGGPQRWHKLQTS